MNHRNGVGERPRIDQERVRQMRRLIADGGEKAVEHRFGEEAKATPEYREAQRQRDAAKRRAQEQRERAASETRAKEHSATRTTPRADGSMRDRALDARKKASEREKDSLSL